MQINLRFPNPVTSSAEAVFGMEGIHKLTEDMEAQRQGMVDYLDTLNYMNGNSFDGPLETRHAIAYMGMALPSLAYIDPHKTREMCYNLNLIVRNISSYHLLTRAYPYNSENVLLIEKGMVAALYRMISGNNMHDETFHKCAEKIYDINQKNQIRQHVPGIDTTRGRFEVMPNAISLMVLEIHDRVFGSRYGRIKDEVISFIKEKLEDTGTGMYYESYQTGCIGYAGESVNPISAWRTNILRPSVNGLAIAFMNYSDPINCEKAWKNYKEMFLDSLLELKAEDIADSIGASFNTQLGPGSEDIMAAMLAAKEMQDIEVFDKIQTHILETGRPHLWEGHLIFTEFGDMESMIGYFMLFARAHVGWKKLMNHPWGKSYDMDYEKIR